MRKNPLNKRRKGMTSVLETVISVALFSMLLVMLMTVMAHINAWSNASVQAAQTERDLDYLMTAFVADIKSADVITSTGDSLQLAREEDAVLWSVSEPVAGKRTLYRNDDNVIDGITYYQFNADTRELVMINLQFSDGQELNLTVRR